MLNRRGQALIIFVLFLPLLLMFLVYVFDISNILYVKNRLTNLGNTAFTNFSGEVSTSNEDVIDLIKKNDSSIKVDIIKGEKTKLQLTKIVDSNFGQIIGKDKYTVKVVIEKE